jgi:hypothetical protein
MLQNTAVLVSLRNPLGVELNRILYTQDSVKMLDRQTKRAYISDRRNAIDFIPVDLDFDLMQCIFTAQIPGYLRNLSQSEPKFSRNAGEDEIYFGTFYDSGENARGGFCGWAYRDILRPSYLIFFERDKVNQLRIKFNRYVDTGSYRFPGEVTITFKEYNITNELNIKMSGLSLRENDSVHMDIPGSYEIFYR